MNRRILFLIAFAFVIGITWVTAGASLMDLMPFIIIALIGAGILLAGWWAVKSDSVLRLAVPSWLGWLLVFAAILRLGAGLLWYSALPVLGYGGDAETAGYVMSDAYNRDTAAWELAQSDLPLSAAFQKYSASDQYGGLLFLSALIYRFVGGPFHQPLLMIVLTASLGALTVLFTWAFACRIWDEQVAGGAALVVALFPEAILLGSSQMREAVLMTLVMMAFYGLALALQSRSYWGIFWILAALWFSLPFSMLFAVMLAVMLAVFALFLTKGSWLKHWRVWVVLAGLVILVFVVIWFLGDQLLPTGSANPVKILQRWLRQAARLQAYSTEHTSGWMQKIFDTTPPWTHTWLLLTYGVARPFLPAALFDPGASIWQGIAIWRALGWALMLPFLFLAPILAWRRAGFRSPAMGLSILVWLGILVASFRGGGDAWDNPRYRVTWIGLQAVLVAWVWVVERRERSLWLRRALFGAALVMVWWLPWYLGRVTVFVWPIQNVFVLLAFGLISAGLYLFLDIWLVHSRQTKSQNIDDNQN